MITLTVAYILDAYYCFYTYPGTNVVISKSSTDSNYHLFDVFAWYSFESQSTSYIATLH